MSRVFFLITLAVVTGCSAPSKKDRDAAAPPKALCECNEKMDGCDCPHCMSMGSGMESAGCPCAKRGYK